MSETSTFVARAFCSVDEENAEYEDGMRGAYASVACRESDLIGAVQAIASELAENALTLRGFDFIFDTSYMDREPSEYETELISRLSSYPVQFENVHYFKPDS
ncbi:MAG: hypothetical protein KDA46_03550 [Parvularculaceae bacterium]|nr:hypothetical protein [Parvularculaceae bacterium]